MLSSALDVETSRPVKPDMMVNMIAIDVSSSGQREAALVGQEPAPQPLDQRDLAWTSASALRAANSLLRPIPHSD